MTVQSTESEKGIDNYNHLASIELPFTTTTPDRACAGEVGRSLRVYVGDSDGGILGQAGVKGHASLTQEGIQLSWAELGEVLISCCCFVSLCSRMTCMGTA